MPVAERTGRNEGVVVALVTVAAVVLLYARAPFAPQQLWAEDGRDFLGDAIRLGPIESLGQDQQAGYYMLGSRMSGVLASLVPMQAAATAVWLWVASVTAWLVATVTVSSRTWLHTWPARVVLALGLVLLPVLGVESIANAANLQVTMLFTSLIVLISRPRSRAERVNACIVLVATALTTTVAAVLLPFALCRLFTTRRFRWDALSISWAAGVALQWVAVAVGRPDPVTRDGDALPYIARRIWSVGLRENVLPFDAPEAFAPLVVLALAALVSAGAWVAWTDGQHMRAVWLVVMPTFGIGLFVFMSVVGGAQSRYVVTPMLSLVWAILAASESLAGRVASSGRVSSTTIMAVVGAVLVIVWLPRWSPSAERQSGPRWDAALEVARTECAGQPPDAPVRILTSPMGEENPRQWTVLVSCRDL